MMTFDYSGYWNSHALAVGHRTAVTPLSEEEYTALHRDVVKQLGPPKVQKMLDYGCGPALLLPIVREIWGEDTKYFGVDISQEMVEYCWDHAKSDMRAWFYNSKGSPMDYCPESYFDFLTCHSVFTHLALADAIALLKELHRFLIPGGTASISILDEPLGDANFQGCLERCDYNRRFFEGMLVQAGFSIEKTYRKHQHYFGVRKV